MKIIALQLYAYLILSMFFLPYTMYYGILTTAMETGSCVLNSEHAPCPQEWLDRVEDKPFWFNWCSAMPEKCTKIEL